MPENLAALRDSGEFETYKGVGAAAPAKGESAYERAFLKTHDDIMADLGKLAYMAGTTAVTAFTVGEMLQVGNVGDSRAVLGQKQGDSEPWSALDLTKDQNCFRRDERERIHREAKMPVEFLTLGMFYGEEEITEDFEEESLALAADPPGSSSWATSSRPRPSAGASGTRWPRWPASRPSRSCRPPS